MKKNTKTHKEGMLHKPAAHPGLERDSKGKPIPMKKRLSEDRASAKRAVKATKKSG
ncbi:MAG TPA: hypothetical protein VHU87_07720 [Rhizomicrobium sp.]|jgi:hypothetical protein|nr:hypothetical protein [Rhizomicrobium sp.]